MTVTPTGVDHVALNVSDVPAAIDFYTNILGLEIDRERPDFGIAGAWLHAGGQQVHLIELPGPPKLGQHFALLYDDLNAVVAALRAQGVEVTDPSPSGPNRHQAFVTDPSGNDVELHQHPRP
jgi:glyoxylase I family protein